MRTPKTLSTLLISVLPNATKAQMENTFLSEMERTSQELPDMHQSILTSVMNNQEEMILKLSGMYCCISLEDLCHGKVFQEDQSKKNMQTLKRRRRKWPSKNFARINQRSSESSCTTAEAWVSLKTQIIRTSLDCLSHVWRDMDSTWSNQISFGIRIDSYSKRNRSSNRWWRSLKRSQRRKQMMTSECRLFITTAI